MSLTALFLALWFDGEILVNSSQSKWQHEAGDPAGSESVTLREDPQTGAYEGFVRYPAGHVFTPHWHSVNERIVLLEGRMKVGELTLEPGGYAFFPAKHVHRLACVSDTRCACYLSWDGKADFHRSTQ